MESKALFSSISAEWETPQPVFNYMNNLHKYELDVCSTKENHKCSVFFTKEEDGLSQDWHKSADRAFMNPVYGNPEYPCKKGCRKKKCIQRGYHNDKYIPGIDDWMRKAYIEAKEGHMLVGCVIPARTDTGWWHRYCMSSNEIWFVKGRLSFINRTLPSWKPDGPFKASPAPFPSAIVVFDGLNNKVPAKPLLKTICFDKKTGIVTVV